jgi:hypothetical protein
MQAMLSRALIEAHGDPPGKNDTRWQDEVEEDFHSGHDCNPPRARLASKCSATAAKSQITVPAALAQEKPGADAE